MDVITYSKMTRLADEVSEIKNAITYTEKPDGYQWDIGSLQTGTGEEINNNTSRVRSTFIPVVGGEIIKVTGNANCLIVYCYSSEKQYISDSAWTDGNEFTVPVGTGFIRILIRKSSSNPTVTESDIIQQVDRCTIVRCGIDTVAADEYYPHNLVPDIGTSFDSYTGYDVTFVWNSNKTMVTINSASGPSGSPHCRWLYNQDSLCGLTAGKTYLFDVECSRTGINVDLYFYTDGVLGTQRIITTPTLIAIPAEATGILSRINVLSTAGVISNATVKIRIYEAPYDLHGFSELYFSNRSIVPTGTDLNTVIRPGSYLLLSANTYTNAPEEIGSAIMLVVRADNYWMYQIVTDISHGRNNMFVRIIRTSDSYVVSDWNDIAFPNRNTLGSNVDLDTVLFPGTYLITSGNANCPVGVSTGMLVVFRFNKWVLQLLYSISPTDDTIYYRSIRNSGAVFRTWMRLTNNYTYNITQEINRDTISNTYTSTISPTITTDTNGWLQPTGDQTDMASAITAMLANGYCHLAPGDFYVSGNIDMPTGSTLEGCGENSVIHLLDSVESGYCVQVIEHNTVRGIKFSGGSNMPENLYTDGTTLGSRHGIVYIGNRDGKESSHSGTHETSIITDCFFENFDGSGIYGRNVGGGINQGLRVSKCYINRCRAGINLDYYVEYCTFSDCLIRQCYYACINNGGNNVFTGCIFHGVVGFLIDNSNEDKGNNSHGSCVGCVFNHEDNMNHPETLGGGLSIHVINCNHGFIFTGCQFWYGNVLAENSKGIAISNSLFGNSAIGIEVTGQPAFFTGNIFYSVPTLSVTAGSKFTGNYTITGTEVKP